MGNNIFVSYKHKDDDVYDHPTARGYVDEIIDMLEGVHTYKGEEADNDLSKFKDSEIESELKDKIFRSSVTIVLISPKMKTDEDENDQWIPWELSYSLKKISRQDITSQTNAIVAVILPDASNSYEHFIKKSKCHDSHTCNCITYQTQKTFEIIENNVHNKEGAPSSECTATSKPVYTYDDSYAVLVKWNLFKTNFQRYIDEAIERQDNIDDYDVRPLIKYDNKE